MFTLYIVIKDKKFLGSSEDLTEARARALQTVATYYKTTTAGAVQLCEKVKVQYNKI